MEYTRKLAEYVYKTKFEDFPKEVVDQTCMFIMDTMGCALGGYTLAHEEAAFTLKYAKNNCGAGSCTIWCDGGKTNPAFAALVNAAMVHTVDYDDTHMGCVAHFGAALVPTVMALAERYGYSGKDIITAVIMGMEVGARVGRSAMPSHYNYWHPTATFGGIAAATAAAKILGLSALQIEQVIGHAADQAGGMRYCIEKGDFSKSLHPSVAGMKAVIFAEIVKDGADGPVGFLEYKSGFCNAFSEEPKFDALTKDLGNGHFQIMDGTIKSFPTIQLSHTGIQSTLDICRANNIKPEEIIAVEIEHTQTVPGQGCNYAPATVLACRLSLPFCVALAAYDGKVTLTQFTEERLHDPAIMAFMPKVVITPNPGFRQKYPETIASFVKIKTTRGDFEGNMIYPKGDPRNRMTRDEMFAKFHELADNTYSPSKVDAIAEAILNLPKASRVDELMAALKVT